MNALRLQMGLLGSLLSTLTWAAPVAYNESVDGDLPSFTGFQTSTFQLEAGINTIRGTMSVMPDEPYVDYDEFRFLIGTGLELVSATVRVDNAQGDVAAVIWVMPRSLSGPGNLSLDVESPSTLDFTNDVFASPANLAASGGFDMLMRGHGIEAAPGTTRFAGSADWLFTFGLRATSVSVPEPGSAVLGAIALGMLVLSRLAGSRGAARGLSGPGQR